MRKSERLQMVIRLLEDAKEYLELYELAEDARGGHKPFAGSAGPSGVTYHGSHTAIQRRLTEARVQLLKVKKEMDGDYQ